MGVQPIRPPTDILLKRFLDFLEAHMVSNETKKSHGENGACSNKTTKTIIRAGEPQEAWPPP